MVNKEVKIVSETGLHLRPAGTLCREAMKFSSYITFKHKEGEYNAKSVLSVLGACVKKGDTINIFCDGDDEQEALEALVEVIKRDYL